MNQTTIYIGIGVVVLIVIIVAVMMSRKKTEVKTETKTEVISCNSGYIFQNGECKFEGCIDGKYNDLNEKKCKNRTKVCPQPQRACETVTENPNADECITDISRCCKENEFEYNGECRTDCPTGTIVSGKKCIAGNCPQGFYRSDTDKGGKYRDSKGICQDYNNAFIKYKENYLTDANKQCKNVVFNPNADDITITNKQGSSCSLNEGESGRCDNNAECKFAGCVSGFYDRGNKTCVRDCSNNIFNATLNIKDTVNNKCVSSCPDNTYYNKIMNGETVVTNECVNNCRNVRSQNFYNVDKPLFNYKINSTDKTGFCISCRQDKKWVYNDNSSIQENTVSKGAALDSFENIYGSNRVLKNNVYTSEDVLEGQTFLTYNNMNCSS